MATVKMKRRTAAQLAADGFAALVEKLGLAEAVRFVQLYDHGEGDYTRERRQWLDSLRHEEVAGLMAEAEKQHSSRKKRGRRKGAT